MPKTGHPLYLWCDNMSASPRLVQRRRDSPTSDFRAGEHAADSHAGFEHPRIPNLPISIWNLDCILETHSRHSRGLSSDAGGAGFANGSVTGPIGIDRSSGERLSRRHPSRTRDGRSGEAVSHLLVRLRNFGFIHGQQSHRDETLCTRRARHSRRHFTCWLLHAPGSGARRGRDRRSWRGWDRRSCLRRPRRRHSRRRGNRRRKRRGSRRIDCASASSAGLLLLRSLRRS